MEEGEPMNTLKKIVVGIFVAAFVWLAGTNAIFQLSHPEVTQTQAMFHIWKTVTLDFSTEAKP